MIDHRIIRILGVVFVLLLLVSSLTAAKSSASEGSGSVSATPGNAGARISQAPLSPEFVEYQMMKNKGLEIAREKAVNGRGLGLVPSPVSLSYPGVLAGDSGADLSEDTVQLLFSDSSDGLPAYYDLRELGRVTPVKNQGPLGTCWAFATYGSLESYLVSEPVPEARDFSENNMNNLLSSAAPEGFDFAEGGNQFMSTAYLARWSGPVAENDDPYLSSSYYAGYPDYPEQKHVQEVLFLPGAQGPSADEYIKQAIMDRGAVYSTMYISSSYLNSITDAYYYSGSVSSNHAITIVGWDDTFSRDNFLSSPPGDGAFIVKNSWGTSWGENGYFYISYYDSRIGTSNAVFTAEAVDNYDCIYQYDPLGWTTNVGYGTGTAWGANVFTANSDEEIKAVSFYTTDSNTAYVLYIYTDPENGPLNPSGPVCSASGTISGPGYHTVPVNGVQVRNGQKFSVVVKLTNPADRYPVALEMPFSGYSSKASANAGESYLSSNGVSWSDLTSLSGFEESNICIKAFAIENSMEMHDVAVAGISAPSRVVMGDSATIAVTVENQGSFTETFDVTLFSDNATPENGDDDLIIGTQTVSSLEAGASKTLTYTWNTGNSGTGNHILTATAETVAGESETLDNSMAVTVSVEEELHDVAVKAVSASSQVIVGDPVAVNVVVENEGNRVETFEVMLVSDNATPDNGNDDLILGTKTVTSLESAGSETLTYTWNTEGSNIGVHTLTATAGAVAGENDLLDNSGSTATVVKEESAAPEMYVSDIFFKKTGPHLKAIVTISVDSDADSMPESTDAPAGGAEVSFTLTCQEEQRAYTGITDSSGVVEFQWKSAPMGTYVAEVVGISLNGYVWNSALDLDNPDSYTK
ncbi:peptidase C1 [Methanosarcina sp. KYL-1]|uniref:lectin like domain-containing protein n=1 Tax=Methanosarcina sp. KYL-1 TaxID=2602068 RepID=UPI002100942C|nr:peptidase C1 [Methanosarcina sp. KYL-1]